jgi:hypothetical protein
MPNAAYQGAALHDAWHAVRATLVEACTAEADGGTALGLSDGLVGRRLWEVDEKISELWVRAMYDLEPGQSSLTAPHVEKPRGLCGWAQGSRPIPRWRGSGALLP